MSVVTDAIDWALNRYNSTPSFRLTTVEIGNVLWADRTTAQLKPGTDVQGKNGGQVAPYTPNDNLGLLSHHLQQGDEFFGDFHCHIRKSVSWLAHFPSPSDIANTSCLCDRWALVPPVTIQGHMITDLPIKSRFQLVQANLFGDVFVIEAAPTRSVFASLSAQTSTMKQIETSYTKWHGAAHGRLGNCGPTFSHVVFVAQVRSELAAMNATLGGRATIRFEENTNFVSDGPNFTL